ncbi:hypothetical protein L1987_55350 [Smallanthus sonchifolius]|uniref:Uncharacterized protein n=1 Tax=Smallanthus sonchifolius TaxID=185202 RepID=A0ACB9EAR2_9ASTR|nr:hypothetical protein L1987_55350 [Smallanthus sonchifolius]
MNCFARRTRWNTAAAVADSEVGDDGDSSKFNRFQAHLSKVEIFYVSLLQHFAPIMEPGMILISRYGGGMSSAKAALESAAQVLAFEAGRKHGIRVNTVSAVKVDQDY